VTTSPAASVAAGASTTFTVSFNPSASGARTAALHIASNDATQNPFNINVTGTGTVTSKAVPEIVLEQPVGQVLASGETRNFGTLALHKRHATVLIVRNTAAVTRPISAVTLRLSRVVLSGPNASEFHLIGKLLQQIQPGRRSTITVQFAPMSEGNKEALLSIFSNDPNESPYLVKLIGRTPNSYTPDAYEKDNTAADAKPIRNRESQTHNIDSAGDVDWVSFTVTRHARQLQIATQDSKSDIGYVLYGPNDPTLPLATNNGALATLSAGTYFIKAFCKHPAGTVASYTLSATWLQSDDENETAKQENEGKSRVASAVPKTAQLVPTPAVASSATPKPAALPVTGTIASAKTVPSSGFNDALYNLLANAAGVDPSATDIPDPEPQPEVVTVNGQDYPALSFRRLIDPGNLVYVVEESADLSVWQALPLPWQLVGVSVDQGDGTELLTVRSETPLAADEQRVLRVRVEEVP
jgi:hypothetical protein